MQTVRLNHSGQAAMVPVPAATRSDSGRSLRLAWGFRFLLLPGLTGGLAALSMLLCLLAWQPAHLGISRAGLIGFNFRQPAFEAKSPRPAPALASAPVAPAKPKPLPLADRQRKYWPLVRRLANANDLEPSLVMAVVQAESHFLADAVSRKGASGLMQIIPETAAQLGLEDPFDPEANLEAGIAYLAKLKKRFKGDMVLTLAAYNAGPTKVMNLGAVPEHAETQAYIDKVLDKVDYFRSRFQSLAQN